MPFFLRYIFHFFAFKLSFHLDQKKSWAKRRKKNFTPYILKHFNKNSWRVLKKTQRREKHAILCAYIDCLYLIYSQNKKNEQKKMFHFASCIYGRVFSYFLCFYRASRLQKETKNYFRRVHKFVRGGEA